MRTIFIMLDSLNRHYISPYNKDAWVQTPNINRLARQGITFDNHYCGSMPCMPARRDMFTGRLSFLETPWSPIQPWDDCLLPELHRQCGTYSHMITDHYHYFHSGGECYHTRFNSWEFLRGQEGDVWHPLVKDPETPDFKGKNRRAYWVNRKFMNPERDEDYSTPQCFIKAIDFLDHNHGADNWHLHLECFDPHEPFACPSKYRDMYGDTWDNRYHFDWPDYAPTTEGDEAVAHIRKSYAGTLTMADFWLGKLLDKMDALDMWKDTTVVLTTDHGHLLGEHGYWAKNYMFDYDKLTHIPLFVCAPGVDPRRSRALTTTMDLMPTFMELHGGDNPLTVQAKSMVHLFAREESHNEALLYGYFGKDMGLTDGRYTYCRQPTEGAPIFNHTANPCNFSDFEKRDVLARAELGVFMPHTYGIPHFRIKSKSRRHHNAPDHNLVYDLEHDPEQQKPIHNPEIESGLASKMKVLLNRYHAPECQYERLGF